MTDIEDCLQSVIMHQVNWLGVVDIDKSMISAFVKRLGAVFVLIKTSSKLLK